MLRDVLPRIEDWLSLGRSDLERLLGRRLRQNTYMPRQALQQAEADLARLESEGQRAVNLWSAEYPPLLREIPDPPLVLFARGGRLPCEGHPVAVVGTRHPTTEAARAAYVLGADLSQRGLVVLSGLAFGIDAQAHRGALLHGPTVAVLAGGVDRITPCAHRPLARAILEAGGTLVSEHPPGEPPLKYRFFRRNRLISGMARSVVIVQAPRRSGALITARFALEQDRDLYVHRQGLHPEAGAGGLDLVAQGAPVIEGVDDLLPMRRTSWMP